MSPGIPAHPRKAFNPEFGDSTGSVFDSVPGMTPQVMMAREPSELDCALEKPRGLTSLSGKGRCEPVFRTWVSPSWQETISIGFPYSVRFPAQVNAGVGIQPVEPTKSLTPT